MSKETPTQWTQCKECNAYNSKAILFCLRCGGGNLMPIIDKLPF